MAGLFSILNSTATALNAQSEGITVTGNNIANVNNPNYAEESVDFQPLGMVQTAQGPQSVGVSATVTSSRDDILDQMVRQEDSLASNFTAQQGVLQQAQAALDENVTSSSASSSTTSTTTESGLSSALSSFFNSFQSLAANPTDSDEISSVLSQASVLADRFQQADQNLSQVQTAANQQVASDVTTVNGLLTQIAQLNGQISSLETNAPGSAVQLRDQREGDLETLANLMPVNVTESANGEDTVTALDGSGNAVTLVSQATVPNTLSFSGGVISAGSPPDALNLTSGSMQGTLTAATGAVQTLRTSLDQLAQQIVTSVNAAYNPSDTPGGNFFDASGTTAGTISLDPNLTENNFQVGDGTPGDNSIAMAVAAVANQTFSTGSGDAIDGTITDSYAGTVASIGQAVDTANTQVEDQNNVQTIVDNERASESGVSIDQEMSNLVTYQRAYQASSEVFQVIDELLSTLVQDLGMV